MEEVGEDPLRAIINFLGLIEDRDAANRKIEWVVTDHKTGIEHVVTLSCAELDAIAERDVDYMMRALKKKAN